MNTSPFSYVQAGMKKFLSIWLILLLGCGDALSVADPSDENDSGSNHLGGPMKFAEPRFPSLSEDGGQETDTSADTADAAVEEDTFNPCRIEHRCPLGEFDYISCTPLGYNAALVDEQIRKAKAAAPASWVWSGVSTIHCDGARPSPTATGELCAHVTLSTESGLVEAVWCRSGALAGRYRRTSDPVNICPYGTDPIAWW